MSVSFNGSSDILKNTSDIIGTWGGNLVIGCWFQTADLGGLGLTRVLFELVDSTDAAKFFRLEFQDKKKKPLTDAGVTARLGNSAGDASVTVTPSGAGAVAVDTWHFAAASFHPRDGSGNRTIDIFFWNRDTETTNTTTFDSTQAKTVSISTPWACCGAHWDGSAVSKVLNGIIGEVAVWVPYWDVSTFRKHFDDTNNERDIPMMLPALDDIIWWWPLWEQASTQYSILRDLETVPLTATGTSSTTERMERYVARQLGPLGMLAGT
jgi:hypothetical protein